MAVKWHVDCAVMLEMTIIISAENNAWGKGEFFFLIKI